MFLQMVFPALLNFSSFKTFMTTPFFLGMDPSTLVCVMMFYSFIGWFYESTIFSIVEQGKLMNRGCFLGPYLPIYCVVGILNLYLLSDVESPFKIALISALTCCAVEYITSWGLEKVFHARYWDYSYFPLNINGRISVVSGVFFGVAILFLIKVLHPFTIIMLSKIPENVKLILAIIFWVVFWTDAILTVIGMCNLNRKCKEIYDAIDGRMDSGFDKINDKKEYFKQFTIVEKSSELIVKLKGINKKFVSMETRIIEAYPDFHSYSYSEVTDKLKEALHRRRHRKTLNEAPEEDKVAEDNNTTDVCGADEKDTKIEAAEMIERTE